MKHRLPDGTIATRTTDRPYTHVICGVWSQRRIDELLAKAYQKADEFAQPENGAEARSLRRAKAEILTYSQMRPGGHYVVSWELSFKDAEAKRKKSQRHVNDKLYVSEINPP